MLLEHYSLNNVCVKGDIVLNNKGIDLKNIYREIPQFQLPDIQENSVAIIPNGQTIQVGNKEQIFDLYSGIIHELLQEDKTIYLLSHSTQDATFCATIKSSFEDEEKVIFLEKDFSCLEFNELVKRFDFAIASRFHSIVHAYKNGIPCIVLGWAVKYYDLTKMFGQEQYLYDAREDIDKEKVVQSIRMMNQSVEQETKKIKETLAEIQKENVFEILSMEK